MLEREDLAGVFDGGGGVRVVGCGLCANAVLVDEGGEYLEMK